MIRTGQKILLYILQQLIPCDTSDLYDYIVIRDDPKCCGDIDFRDTSNDTDEEGEVNNFFVNSVIVYYIKIPIRLKF